MTNLEQVPTVRRISADQLRHICRTGLSTRAWTPHEVAIVKKHFPNQKKLTRLLPNRTWIAIRSRAGLLGLRRKKLAWLARDVATLRKLWPAGATLAELQEALPRYTVKQIREQARSHRLHRPDFGLKKTKFFVINQIKERARALNMTMRDVDALAGSGRYFYSAAWRFRNTPHPRHVARAVVALDGELTAAWR